MVYAQIRGITTMYVKKNQKGRDFLVGDIHGMYDTLMDKLAEVNFDINKDRLFSVGDLIDRGPNSKECLDLLYSLWFYAVLGNHEDLLVQGKTSMPHFNCHIQNGGYWIHSLTKDDYNRYIKLVKEKMPRFITLEVGEGQTLGICHAEPPTRDWKDLDALTPNQHEKMIWGRGKIMKRFQPTTVANVTATVHGHTPTDDIVLVGNSFFIDTGGCFKDGHLTVIEVNELLRVLSENNPAS